MRRRARVLGALIPSVSVLLGCATVTLDTVAGATPARAGAAIEWQPCGRGFECAEIPVPVDYADPGAGDLALALTRRPAGDPDERIGTLVVNFGGPGDAGAQTLRLAAGTVPGSIRRRFDLVSFDPRGTGSSRPVTCVDDSTFERAWSEDPTPDGDGDLPGFYDGTSSSVDLVAECVARHGDWLARLGTRNVARDLDQIRIALGDDRLSFLGYSYGTLLGALYAQEFPDRVRSMVLDSAVDLSSTMVEEQRAHTAGFERALDAFLDECASDRRCAFHSDGDPGAALARLRARFEQGVRIDGGDGRTVGTAEFYVALVAALYSRTDWPFLAEALESAATADDGSTLLLFNDLYAGRREDGTYSNLQQVLGIIVCDDRSEPLVSFDEFRATYAELSSDYPFFGPLFASGPAGCDARLPAPRPDEVVGDVRVAEAPPVLVIGTTRDPATPYVGAQDLQRRIAGSRLLTVDGTTHGGYATGNGCVDRVVNRTLLSGRLPSRDRRC